MLCDIDNPCVRRHFKYRILLNSGIDDVICCTNANEFLQIFPALIDTGVSTLLPDSWIDSETSVLGCRNTSGEISRRNLQGFRRCTSCLLFESAASPRTSLAPPLVSWRTHCVDGDFAGSRFRISSQLESRVPARMARSDGIDYKMPLHHQRHRQPQKH